MTYSALMVAPAFYKAFADFRFVLIYQLDCLVFVSKLLYRCAMDYDYIGAPWLDVDFGAPFNVEPLQAPRRRQRRLLAPQGCSVPGRPHIAPPLA